MADITYLDKDKTAGIGTPQRTWRDVDANEVKNVINNFRASLVAGKVPNAELPNAALKIGSAIDFDPTGITDGYVVYWDQTAGKFRVKVASGGANGVQLDSNNIGMFLFGKTIVGETVTLFINFDDQLPGSILAAPTGATGTPTFQQIVDVLEALVGADQFNVDFTRGGSAFDLVNDFYQDGTVLDKGLNVPFYRINKEGVALAPQSNDTYFVSPIQ